MSLMRGQSGLAEQLRDVFKDLAIPSSLPSLPPSLPLLFKNVSIILRYSIHPQGPRWTAGKSESQAAGRGKKKEKMKHTY